MSIRLLFVLVVCVADHAFADLTLSLTPSLATNNYQYGYNVTVACRLDPDAPVYGLNISIANSTRSWLRIDRISSAPWAGYTASIGTLSASRYVTFIGSLLIPAQRSASLPIVINANWTDSSRTVYRSTSASSSIILIRSSNDPPRISQLKSVRTIEDTPVLLHPFFRITDEDFFSESDEGVMTISVSVLSSLSSLSLDSLVAASHGASISVSEIDRIEFSCDFNCALATFEDVLFVPAPHWSGISTLNLTVDDNFHGGVGGYHISEHLFNVTVASHNQAPRINSNSATFTVYENNPLPLSNISISDIDAASSENFTLMFSAVDGRFVSAQLPGTNSSLSAHALIMYGPYSVISSFATSSVSYYPLSNSVTQSTGFDTITVTTIDGFQSTCTATFQVDVLRSDASPKLISSNYISVYEDFAVDIPISINDTHSDLGRVYSVSLSVSNGSISLASLSGLEFILELGNVLYFLASSLDANLAMGPITYKPKSDFFGSDTLAISAKHDNGIWSNSSVRISVIAVNDAPRIQVSPSAPLTGVQGSTIPLNISVVDVDDGNVTVSLFSSNGSFSFGAHSGLNLNASSLSGPQVKVSAALTPVTFLPFPFVFGMTCSLTIHAKDIHNAESTLSIPVYLTRTNTMPVISAPGYIQSNPANTTLLASISVSDYEDDNLYLSCKATNGSVKLPSTEGLRTLSANGDNLVVFGKSVSINQALSKMEFIPDPFFSGNATLILSLNDTVYSSSPRLVSIIVAHTKTAPKVTCPDLLFVDEGYLTNLGPVQLYDSSVVNPKINFTVSSSSGSIQVLSLPAQLMMSGNTSKSLSFYGPYLQINSALAQLRYRSSRCCVPDSVTYTISRGSLSSSCQTDVIIKSVHQVPIISTCALLPAVLGAPSLLSPCLNLTNRNSEESIYSRSKLHLQAVDGGFLYDFVDVIGAGVNIDSSGSHHLFVSGPVNRLTAVLDQGFISYNGSANKASADVISVVLTDFDADVNVTSRLPVALLHNPVQITLTEGHYRATLEDTTMTIQVAAFGVNSVETSVNLTVFSTVSGSSLNLVSANNAFVVSRLSSNNLTLHVPVSNAHENITLGYTPTPNWNSDFSPEDVILFQIGNKEHARIEVTVNAINDAPSLSMLAAVDALEDVPFRMNVTVQDVDLSDAPEPYLFASVFLVPQTGVLALGTDIGLQTSVYSGSRIDFNGSLGSINEAMENLQLTFPLYHGLAVLHVCISDNGFSGSGGVRWTNRSSVITVAHVNHPPSLVLVDRNNPILLYEDSATLLNFTLVDPDNNTDTMFTATLKAGSNLNVTMPNGATVLRDSFLAVKKALQNVTVKPQPNWNGFGQFITVSISDGQAQANEHYDVIVLATPDEPSLHVNCSVVASVNEDHDIFIRSLSLIQDISDPDYATEYDADTLFRLSLSAVNGTVTVADGDISRFYTPSDFLLHKSSLSSLAIRYLPNPDFNGPDLLTIVLNDTTGTALDRIACPITVLPVEDPVRIHYDPVMYIVANTPTKLFGNVTLSRVAYESETMLFCNVTFRYGFASATIPSSNNLSMIENNLQHLTYSSNLRSADEDVATIIIGHEGYPTTYNTASIEIVVI